MKRFSAYRMYLLYSGATSLFYTLVFTVFIVYYMERVHLNPLQLVLVGTVLETVCFVFEIPTGIVADIYSRKLSVIIGLILIGAGFALEGSIPKFGAVIASQIIWGIGATFISGAIDAWIADEEKGMSLERIFIKGSQAGQIGTVVGLVLAMVIGNVSVQLSMIASGCLFILFALFLAVFMPENHFQPSAPRHLSTFGKMGHTLKNSLSFVKGKPILLLLLGVTLFYGLSSEGYDRLSQAHLLKDTTLPRLGNLQPVTWFGIFGILGMILSAGIMQLVIKKLENSKKLQSASILLVSNMFYILCLTVFALTRNFGLMLAAYLSTNMFRSLNEPMINAWMNQHINEGSRATVLSLNGQVNALGQIFGGPIIGVIASKVSVSVGIGCTALLLLPVLAFYYLLQRNGNS